MSKILLFMTDTGLQLIDDKPFSNIGEEYCGMYRALEKMGHEPYFLVNDDIKSNKYRVVHDDVDVNFFEEIIMNREVPNFFGGDLNRNHKFTVDTIVKFKGTVGYYFCDPEMAKGNYISEIYRKVFEANSKMTFMGTPLTTEERYRIFNKQELLDNAYKVDKENLKVWSAYPIKNHAIHSRFKNIVFIDSWREHLFYLRKETPKLFGENFVDILKSACYIGSNKPSRHKRLKEFGLFNKEAEESGLIKFYGKIARFKETDNKRVVLSNVNSVYEKHIASLVTGNTIQNNTGINHRFLQGLTISRSMIIDNQVDKNRMFMRSDFLNNNLYANTAEEYIEKLEFIRNENNFNKVISLLEQEKQWIMNESVEDFIKRVS